VTGSSWNPPTGPPNGVPVGAAEARQEIDAAVAAARGRDAEVRAWVAEAVVRRVMAAERLPIAEEDVADALVLARRALRTADESARAGQGAEAARLRGAARVFALRLRDARQEVARLERHIAAATERIAWAERTVAENAGRLEAVALARLPALRGRKALKAQSVVDDTVAEVRRPLDETIARATDEARAALAADEVDDTMPVVGDDELESELDFEAAEEILAELANALDLDAHPAGARPATTGGATVAEGGEDATVDLGADAEASDADAGAAAASDLDAGAAGASDAGAAAASDAEVSGGGNPGPGARSATDARARPPARTTGRGHRRPEPASRR
jgi:hypothetical protein